MEFDTKPLDEEPEVEVKSDRPGLDAKPFDHEVAGAIQAAGVDEVAAALEQVTGGKASADALLAWMDELRDPEEHHAQDAEPATGLLHDFEADTEFASGDRDVPPIDQPEQPVSVPDTDASDSDYFFSAVRKRRLEEEEDGEGDMPAPETPEKKPTKKPAPKKR